MGIPILITISIGLLSLNDNLFESVNGKIINFLAGEGSRAIVYADMANRILNEPSGLGKGRYIENNNLNYTGEGIVPHHNFLGIGVELGVIPLILYTLFVIFYILKYGYLLIQKKIIIEKRLRLIIAISLGVFVYQQFRGFFHDTWTLKEMYVWIGVAAGAVYGFRLNAIVHNKS